MTKETYTKPKSSAQKSTACGGWDTVSLKKVDDNNIDNAESVVVSLVKILRSVKIDSEESKLNEISMSDNNGGRIYF